jgi:Ser/Thr protein kinase RdoA (MazF antagonist)
VDSLVVADVLDALGLLGPRVTALKDAGPGNASWLVETESSQRVVLRCYHDQATLTDIAYEHGLLRRLDRRGWAVPAPLSPVVEVHSRVWCLTRYVFGRPRTLETPEEGAQRGRDLARLQVAMRELTEELGQRPGWRPQHTAPTVHEDIDWNACVNALATVDADLATWARVAQVAVAAALGGIGAPDLPLTLIHGDFAEWNVHYDEQGSLAGVIDFGLAHLDSRPYELAIARTYRSPETIDAYRKELVAHDWPLTELEDDAIPILHRAFRVDMVAWEASVGMRTGSYDLSMIESQLARSGVARP